MNACRLLGKWVNGTGRVLFNPYSGEAMEGKPVKIIPEVISVADPRKLLLEKEKPI